MRNYIRTSLETHLFFGRVMKEHSLFLLAGFPANETEKREKAECFRAELEDALREAVRLADGIVGESVLRSGEIVTEFTEMAECQTNRLTGIPIDRGITEAERKLRAGMQGCVSREMAQRVRNLNRRILRLVNGLIAFKETIFEQVTACRLYTANYPLLIEHILREAKLYRQIVTEIEQRGFWQPQDPKTTEMFWNRIMMEHAQFIRGLLDPSECELTETADGFAADYCRLLEEAKEQDCRAMRELTEQTIAVTGRYREFKTAGVQGITGCRIRSIILPLLADHVLREANHYLRLLEGI